MCRDGVEARRGLLVPVLDALVAEALHGGDPAELLRADVAVVVQVRQAGVQAAVVELELEREGDHGHGQAVRLEPTLDRWIQVCVSINLTLYIKMLVKQS